MGLSGIDESTGVSFKTRKPPAKKNKNKFADELVIDKPKKEVKTSNEEASKEYRALIKGDVLSYSFATDTEVNDIDESASYLGKGNVVIAIITNEDGLEKIESYEQHPDAVQVHFWLKTNSKFIDADDVKVQDEIEDEIDDAGLDGDEFNWSLAGKDLNRNPEMYTNDVKTTVENDEEGGQDDLTNIVKENEEDLTMTTNKDYTKANELLAQVKEAGDNGVDMLIDYCKLSFAEVFTKPNADAGDATVTNDLQEQMVYIITEINKNDLLTPESKAKLVSAIEAESLEYQKLLDTVVGVTDDTKVLLEKKEDDDLSWGTITLIAIGAVLAVGAAYSLYRYFEPEDVVIDMSTMSIMNR